MSPRFLLLSAVLLLPSLAAGQANSFVLVQGGKRIGKASYTIEAAKQGYKLSSRYTFHVAEGDGDFLDEFKLGADYGLADGSIANNNTQRRTTFELDKGRTELAVGSYLGGLEPTTFVPVKAHLLILPSFDPGAAAAILLLATTHPSADNKYSVVLSGGGAASSGGKGGRGGGAADAGASGATDALPAANVAYDAVWVKGSDVTGRLHEKPLTLHTYMLAFGTAKWIFFADDANELMQLNAIALRTAYIRTEFKLDPIAASHEAPVAVTPHCGIFLDGAA